MIKDTGKSLTVPALVLDQDDQEISTNRTNKLARFVDNWESSKTKIKCFMNLLNCGYTFKSDGILFHNNLGSQILVLDWHMFL